MLSRLLLLTGCIARCEIAGVSTTSNDPLATMPLRLRRPVREEADAGAVAHFRHESGDGWTVAGTVSRGPNGLVISHLEVWPGRPGDALSGSVTSKVLASIRVGLIIETVRAWEAREKLQTAMADTEFDPEDETMSRLLEEVFGGSRGTPSSSMTIASADEVLSAHAPEKPQPGRAPLPDELLRQVAEGYIAECGPGRPRGAVKRLAQQLGRPEATVSRWVARARKDGWLGPGASGREVAEPGPKLLAARLDDLRERLELGPHPEGEPMEAKIAREARRMRQQNDAIRNGEEEDRRGD